MNSLLPLFRVRYDAIGEICSRAESIVRLPVPPKLAAWIAERVMAYQTEAPDSLRWLSEYVAAAGALPLYVGWFETTALRPDGEVVSWSTEGDYPGTKSVDDRYIWLTSLVDAANRYPELQLLLPVRPPEARDCRHLAHPMFAEGKVFCPDCCALGWVVDPVTQPFSAPSELNHNEDPGAG